MNAGSGQGLEPSAEGALGRNHQHVVFPTDIAPAERMSGFLPLPQGIDHRLPIQPTGSRFSRKCVLAIDPRGKQDLSPSAKVPASTNEEPMIVSPDVNRREIPALLAVLPEFQDDFFRAVFTLGPSLTNTSPGILKRGIPGAKAFTGRLVKIQGILKHRFFLKALALQFTLNDQADHVFTG
jgi:hypothetical protein